MTVEITAQDRQALRAALRRKPRKIPDLRYMMQKRIGPRLLADPSSTAAKAAALARVAGTWHGRHWYDKVSRDEVYRVSCNAVARLLGEWKRQGLVDNPVRGTWQWVGK